MSVQTNIIGVTALLIGGTNHGAVISMQSAEEIISIAEKGKLVLIVNGSEPPEVKQEEYQLLTKDKLNRAIYVTAIDKTTANETFVDYIFNVFIKGGK